MKRAITLATMGIFLVSLHLPGWAQKEVEAPAVPPILEGQRPLDKPDVSEPAAPKKGEGEKVKPQGKSRPGQKEGKKARLKKQAPDKQVTGSKKKAPKGNNKKGAKTKSKKAAPADKT